MTTKRLQRPRDPIQLAKLIGDIATGQVVDLAPAEKKKSAKKSADNQSLRSPREKKSSGEVGRRPGSRT